MNNYKQCAEEVVYSELIHVLKNRLCQVNRFFVKLVDKEPLL